MKLRPARDVFLALVLLGFSAALQGCAPTIPKDALLLQPDSLARRQLQTRRFDTSDELQLLQASAMVLQDIGFSIDESETKLGLIAGSKSRDATSASQVAGAILLGLLSGSNMPVDRVQHIKASVVTRSPAKGAMNVRVTFQRTVIDDRGQVARVESLEEPVLYQEFFDKLSKSVFLQANNI